MSRIRTGMGLIAVLVMALSLFVEAEPPAAEACVGRILYIGTTRSPGTSILSSLFSTLINERTGTTVKIKYFDDPDAPHKALMAGEVDIILEYTGNALINVLKEAPVADDDKAYELARERYRKQFNVVWLDRFRFSDREALYGPARDKNVSSVAAPVIRLDVLNQFPALPRVMQKLTPMVTLTDIKTLGSELGGGERAEQVSRQFLKGKKLI